MLLWRVISALIGAPLLLYFVYRGGIFILFVTVFLALVALYELLEMAPGLGMRAWKIFAYPAGLILILSAYFEQGRYLPFVFILWLALCLLYFVCKFPDERVSDLSFNFFALSYVVLLFVHLILLRSQDQGIYLTFLAFGLTWATDTGAYFTGRALGRHKLAPLISPNKTVEGAIGGVVFAVVCALAIGYFFPNRSLNTTALSVLGLAVGISGQLGDLVESAIKRFAGVKDSGNLIPGHGGFLDRFDSILFTIPTVYYLFRGLIIN